MIRAQTARRPQCAVKWDRNLKPKLAMMRQCTSVTDGRTDGLASWHKREMYILHLALIKANSPVGDRAIFLQHHSLRDSGSTVLTVFKPSSPDIETFILSIVLHQTQPNFAQ